jgi:hypothetical protein
MLARLIFLLALLLPTPALADPLEGSWALAIGGTPIFRFDLAKDSQGKWHGTWSKPSSFASDGNNFSRLNGPAKKVASATALETPDGIELAFNDPRPGAVPDIFDFKPIDPDAIELVYVGTGLAPYTLERVKPGAPLGPWDAEATYSREASPAQVAAAHEPAAQDVRADPPPEAPPPVDAESFRLKPGAPTGR